MTNDLSAYPNEELERRYISNEYLLHNMEIKTTIKPISFILIFFKFWTKLIQKQTAVTSNIAPVEFSLAKDTAIAGLQIV